MQVGVHVHQAGDDRLAGEVDDQSTRGDIHRPGAADRRDAIAGHDDVGPIQNLVPLHGDGARALQNHRALRARLLHDQGHRDRLGLRHLRCRRLFPALGGAAVAFLALTRLLLLFLRQRLLQDRFADAVEALAVDGVSTASSADTKRRWCCSSVPSRRTETRSTLRSPPGSPGGISFSKKMRSPSGLHAGTGWKRSAS
ncbi:MAG: hypothetical protein DMF52_14725 [Acidobacteria bacterium]|nr:MAG: hypothetical protein DMF52_14725 [Acidobacteriota bacterium]